MMNEEIVMVRGHVLDIPQFEFPEVIVFGGISRVIVIYG
jgi:hypothetical protein